jgi:hypothetical protein
MEILIARSIEKGFILIVDGLGLPDERNLSLTDFPQMYNNSPTFSIHFSCGPSNVSACGKDGFYYCSCL